MDRADYQVYSPGWIGSLRIPNRWVRSATADLAPWRLGQFTEEDITLYSEVARGGVGMLIVNGPGLVPSSWRSDAPLTSESYSYEDVKIDGVAELLSAVRDASPDVVVLAQIGCNEIVSADIPVGPSPIESPFYEGRFRELDRDEIGWIVDSLAEAAVHMEAEGYDGVQLHAAHGGGLWSFLSPYANRRTDSYGGSVENRVRIVREIVCAIRQNLGEYPVLIKANCTDYVKGGIDGTNFPELARALEDAGIAAIEVSGGTWDALIRPEAELGFRPVPAAESHTGILDPEKQDYFLPFVEGLNLGIPVILVGGIRNIDSAEHIVRSGAAEFVAMCRPLICEPDLVARWRDGHGSVEAKCIACNSCIYSMHVPFEKIGRRTVACLARANAALHAEAQQWLTTFIDEIRVDGPSCS